MANPMHCVDVTLQHDSAVLHSVNFTIGVKIVVSVKYVVELYDATSVGPGKYGDQKQSDTPIL